MLKTPIICFLVCISFCSTVVAQNGRYYMKTQGLSAVNVSSIDSADFYRVILPPDSGSNGLLVVKDFYKNGKPKMTGNTSSLEPSKIQLEGACVEFFENGRKMTEKNYVHNTAVGK